MSGISIAIMGLACIGAIAALAFVAWKFRPTGTPTGYSTDGYKKKTGKKGKRREGPGVDEEEQIREIFKKLQEYVDFMFGFTPGDTIEVKGVPAEEICHKCHISSDKSAPLAGLCEEEDGTITLYVQKGLPQDLCYAAMAQEYAHAWQKMEGFGSEGEKKEGFAEWVAFKLTELAGHDAEKLFADLPGRRDESGRKKFEILEEQFGVEGAIRAGKTKDRNLKILRRPEKDIPEKETSKEKTPEIEPPEREPEEQ